MIQVAAHERCVLCLYSAPSETKTCTSRIQSLACFDRLVMAPEVIFERSDCLARRCQWKKKALDTLVLSAAVGRGVVQVAAHERCVLVQCTIHRNLRFKKSITRVFRQLAMAGA